MRSSNCLSFYLIFLKFNNKKKTQTGEGAIALLPFVNQQPLFKKKKVQVFPLKFPFPGHQVKEAHHVAGDVHGWNNQNTAG